MIQIEEKQKCCGCSACEQICPKHCIQMASDRQGFLYPIVDQDNCIDCHLCENVCPLLHQNKEKKPLEAYAAINTDEKVRSNSSSGGIFTLLAEKTLRLSGVVFGAMFNEQWEVVHGYIENPEELVKLRGSKYVQSNINNNFKNVQKFLNQERQVLFSGTPCQIAALRLFLKKDYTNLLLVDVACHGVPSPLVWHDYIEKFKVYDLTSISFRDKRNGWAQYSYVIHGNKEDFVSEIHNENIFSNGFLRNLTLRPSCFFCPAKAGKSGSDITIADFWGIDQVCPEMNDNKGTNLVLVNSTRGEDYFSDLDIKKVLVDYHDAIKSNPAIYTSSTKPKQYDWFWNNYSHYGIRTIDMAIKRMRPSRFKVLTYKLLHKMHIR